ncbi:MAG: peroxiredoxin-like family protein [Pseudomonadota bacterium]|nr:peroxiredoxin-like family protein [Pseudomonadota bacterium]
MSTTTAELIPTLGEQTARVRDEFIASLPESDREIVVQASMDLMASNITDAAIRVGDAAPDFELPDSTGSRLKLSEALARGPVVLNFYRGGWCPYCCLEFRALQARLPEIRALGATLIGISPETPDTSLDTWEKHALDFEVLSDVGNRVVREFGLLFRVGESMRPLLLKWGMDVPAANGDETWELPVPATYVIGRDGVVRAAYVNNDYTQRMEPSDIISALKDLSR